MDTKQLLRAICEHCKKNGERVTRSQARAVLEALKEVSIEACKNGDRVILRKFITIEGAMTTARKLPNGTINEPRLKICVNLSKSLQEDFREWAKENK